MKTLGVGRATRNRNSIGRDCLGSQQQSKKPERPSPKRNHRAAYHARRFCQSRVNSYRLDELPCLQSTVSQPVKLTLHNSNCNLFLIHFYFVYLFIGTRCCKSILFVYLHFFTRKFTNALKYCHTYISSLGNIKYSAVSVLRVHNNARCKTLRNRMIDDSLNPLQDSSQIKKKTSITTN